MSETDLRTELTLLGETMDARFARMEALMHAGFARMDQHIEATHGRFAHVDESMHAGFACVAHWFELQQAQHLELRTEVQSLRAEVRALTQRVDRVEERLASLQSDVGALRDWATREFADVRTEIRRLRYAVVERNDALHGDMDDLSGRVTRLEQRLAEE
jgi:predicted  nucleic acid-binding Zn-ribbon protein